MPLHGFSEIECGNPGSSLLCVAAVLPDRLPTVCVGSESLSKLIKNENTLWIQFRRLARLPWSIVSSFNGFGLEGVCVCVFACVCVLIHGLTLIFVFLRNKSNINET